MQLELRPKQLELGKEQLELIQWPMEGVTHPKGPPDLDIPQLE
jgi:hypothetical protein